MADVGSDHDVVLATLKLKLKKMHHKKSPRIRFDIEKLNEPEIAHICRIGGEFAALNLFKKDTNVLTDNIGRGGGGAQSRMAMGSAKQRKVGGRKTAVDECGQTIRFKYI